MEEVFERLAKREKELRNPQLDKESWGDAWARFAKRTVEEPIEDISPSDDAIFGEK